MSTDNKHGSFIKGATILTAAGIFSRLLGLFFKVPLYHMYGSYGNGIFYNTTSIYNFLLMISTVGIPVAISKMVSENLATKDYKAAVDTLKVSLRTLITVGGISTLFLLLGAQFIINATGWPQDSYWSIIAIAPAPLIVSICCAYRGYYQGFQLMNPTAISQIIEQIVRIISGLILCAIGVYIFDNVGLGVGGSVFGATAGAIASLGVLLIIYPLFKRSRRKIYHMAGEQKQEKSLKVLFKRLLQIAIPVTLTSSIVSFFSVFDSSVYVSRLAVAGIGTDMATSMMGDFGNSELLIQVPLVISGNLAVAFMPSISQSFALRERKALNEKINLAVEVLLLVGLPCCIGLSVLANGITDILFPGSDVAYYLYYYAYVCIFMMISNTFQSILQGIDKFFIPLLTLAIASIIRFVTTWIFLAMPQLNILGIIVSGLITFIFLTVSNYYFLRKVSRFRLDWKILLSFTFSSIMMGIGVFSLYRLLILILPNLVSVLISVLFGVIVYYIGVVMTGGLTYDLLTAIPGYKFILPSYKKLNRFLSNS